MKSSEGRGIDYSKDNVFDAIGRPELNPDNVKDCLFQYATKHKVIEDTDLITKKEADKLVEKYIEDCKDKWDEFDSPELCIWINCKSNVDYHTQGLDIDFRDCILENGHFYRVKKELLK